MMRHLDP